MQRPEPVEHKESKKVNCGYRIDLLVEGQSILERKSNCQRFTKHLLTCMKSSFVQTSLLINFNVTKLKEEIQRFNLCLISLRALRVLRGSHFSRPTGPVSNVERFDQQALRAPIFRVVKYLGRNTVLAERVSESRQLLRGSCKRKVSSQPMAITDVTARKTMS